MTACIWISSQLPARNAEPYATLMDGLLAWRWFYDEQVPLYPFCYDGQAQFVSLAYGRDEEAKYTKSAWQMASGHGAANWLVRPKLPAAGKGIPLVCETVDACTLGFARLFQSRHGGASA